MFTVSELGSSETRLGRWLMFFYNAISAVAPRSLFLSLNIVSDTYHSVDLYYTLFNVACTTLDSKFLSGLLYV